MAGFELVVVASSAGGVQALTRLVSELPADFGLAVVIVQHLDPRHRSLLVDILARRSRLPVELVADRSRVVSACVASADQRRRIRS